MSATTHSTTRNHTRTATPNECPYFVFVLTNYPNLLQRTRNYQRSHQNGQPLYHGGMVIPGVRIHFGNIDSNHFEQLLYNTLRYQLEQVINAYLRSTRRPYPIYLVFDMSHI